MGLLKYNIAIECKFTRLATKLCIYIVIVVLYLNWVLSL